MERVAARDPRAVGLNVTLIVQLAPTFKDVPQVVVREKSEALAPVIGVLLIVIVAVPVFRRVTPDALLLVFTAWMPKSTDVGETLAMGAVPVPLRGTV